MGKTTILGMMISLAAMTTGCGVGKKLCDNKYDTLNGFCDNIVGYEKDVYSEVEQIKKQIVDMEQRLDLLRYTSAHQQLLLERLLQESAENESVLRNLIEYTDANFSLLINQVNQYDQNIANVLITIQDMQSQIIAQQLVIAQLQLNSQPVSTVDPCGDKPGVVDEVGIKLADGRLIFFFDSGNGQQRLAVLQPGRYVTTDGTACRFTVDANNNIVNAHY